METRNWPCLELLGPLIASLALVPACELNPSLTEDPLPTTSGEDESGEPGDGDSGDTDEPGCETNLDCPPGWICIVSWCEQPESDPECYADEDCPGDEICSDLVCVEGPSTLEPCDDTPNLANESQYPLEGPYTLTVGDVDGQGGEELVAYEQGQIVVLREGEAIVSPHPLGFGGPRGAVILQADGDGLADLIVSRADSSDKLHSFIGDGLGGFSYQQAQAPGFEPGRLARARAAQAPDVLISGVHLDDDTHLFSNPLSGVYDQSVVDKQIRTATGDLDGDGVDELVLHTSFSSIEVWAATDEGYQSVESINCIYQGMYEPRPIVGDLDGDGLDDIVCLDTDGDSRITVIVHHSLGGLEFERHEPVLIDGDDSAGWVADLDGDERGELVVFGSMVRVDAQARPLCQAPLWLAGDEDNVVGDFDSDGRDEIASVDGSDMLRTHGLE